MERPGAGDAARLCTPDLQGHILLPCLSFASLFISPQTFLFAFDLRAVVFYEVTKTCSSESGGESGGDIPEASDSNVQTGVCV